MLLSSLLAAAGCRYSTSGMTQTRRPAAKGLRLRSAITGPTCSKRMRSPSRSTTCRSGWMPRRARSHSGQVPQPPQALTSATASSRAKAVLARPSGPLSRYAWLRVRSRRARANISLAFSWPGTSSNTGAPSAAEPQAGGGDRLERRGLHGGGDDVDVAEAVDQTHALREAPRHHGEAGGDPLLEIEAFGLDLQQRVAAV